MPRTKHFVLNKLTFPFKWMHKNTPLCKLMIFYAQQLKEKSAFPLSVKSARLAAISRNSGYGLLVSRECCFSTLASGGVWAGVLCCCVAGLIHNTVAGKRFTCASQSAHSSCIMKGVTGPADSPIAQWTDSIAAYLHTQEHMDFFSHSPVHKSMSDGWPFVTNPSVHVPTKIQYTQAREHADTNW